MSSPSTHTPVLDQLHERLLRLETAAPIRAAAMRRILDRVNALADFDPTGPDPDWVGSERLVGRSIADLVTLRDPETLVRSRKAP